MTVRLISMMMSVVKLITTTTPSANAIPIAGPPSATCAKYRMTPPALPMSMHSLDQP